MKIVFLFVSIMMCLSINAQTILGTAGSMPAEQTQYDYVDISFMECIYLHKIYDPRRDQFREQYDILEIGKKFSGYSNYGAYTADSIMRTRYTNHLTTADVLRICNEHKATWECVLKDLDNGSISTYDRVYLDRYVYSEPWPNINWRLSNGSLYICGYKCNKATAKFRGRKWTAWYCDIPHPNGPWKFGNLPGLILKVEDEAKEHVFEAIAIRKNSKKFGPFKSNYFKTTREKFNSILKEYKTRTSKFINSTNTLQNRDGKKTQFSNKPKFFNPIELE